ncbi:UDP binding domain-containing protein, partial [Guyparkeria sp. 1SP6A2]|nr:UDP binding domain-containing protein [Guyparkeria sp. 1SP6A2]
LQDYGVQVDCYDPWINAAEAEHEYGITPIAAPKAGEYDAVIMTVAHQQFAEMGVEQIRALGKSAHVLYDLKYILPADASDLRL